MKGFQDFVNDSRDKIQDLRDDIYKDDDGTAGITDIINNIVYYPEYLIKLYHEWLFANFNIKEKE